jgi:hypothetical protein
MGRREITSHSLPNTSSGSFLTIVISNSSRKNSLHGSQLASVTVTATFYTTLSSPFISRHNTSKFVSSLNIKRWALYTDAILIQ